MTNARVLVYSASPDRFARISASLPNDLPAVRYSESIELTAALQAQSTPLLVLDIASEGAADGLDLGVLTALTADIPLLLLVGDGPLNASLVRRLIRLQPRDLVVDPFDAATLRAAVVRAMDADHSRAHVRSQAQSLEKTLAEANRRLNARLQELNTIYTVGKSVTSSLDAREILDRVVLASVNLTQADDGFIVLKEGDQLFVRVIKRREDRYTEHLHEATSDGVAWQVIRSQRPAMLNRETEIATGLLVQALLYVPLAASGDGAVGVLGVVNREREDAFSEGQLFALSTLAGFAATALENARLFALREAERSRLSSILEQATEAIIVTDMRDRLWLWSETAARLFELDDQAQGRPLISFVENEDLHALFYEAQGDAEVHHNEVTLDDGQVFNAQLSTIEHVGRVVVMQNITHLKELDRLKSEFVSTVSHDLRTPLTTIQGYVALLERAGPLTDMQADFVDRALRSLTHITSLISDLLDIGRIEAGYDLEMQAVRLDELVRTTVDATQTYAIEENLTLTMDVPRTPLWVWGNQRRLRQVLENLISNAIKYNRPEGWVRVSAGQDGDHIIVRVRDAGIGIPPEEQARIFDRFYRVHAPGTEDVQGTGLGLSIVKSVIEKHKGRIWVESTLGEGSTFSFVIPTLEPTR